MKHSSLVEAHRADIEHEEESGNHEQDDSGEAGHDDQLGGGHLRPPGGRVLYRRGGGGGQVSLMQTRQSVLCDPMLYSNSGSRPRWPPASPPRRACLGVGMKGDSPSGSENGRLEIEPKGLLPLLLPMLLLTTLPLLLFLAAPPLLLLLLASLLEGPRGLTGVLSAVRMGMVVS